LKPLVKWSGGKRKEIKLFRHHYPDNFSTFVEPFLGGGAVYFDLNFEGKSVISDTHEELINFYTQVKKPENCRKIHRMMNNPWFHLFRGKQVKENMGEIYNSLPSGFQNTGELTYYYVRDEFVPKNKVEEAFQFYFLRKTAFRGMLRYNPKGKFNIPFGRYKTMNSQDLLNEEYSSLLKRTKVYCQSFEDMFEIYGGDKDAFFFVDPPYDSAFSDYKHAFESPLHHKLFDCFKNAQAKCLMVIGKSPLISDLYKDYIVDEYEKEYSFKILKGRVGDEINNIHYVIKNYK
tara:strand:- start:470 stop:1336 length:867 start_codon:yes stop_codon:yes gene_type:complete